MIAAFKNSRFGILTLTVFFLFHLMVTSVYGLSNPHWQYNNIECSSCHNTDYGPGETEPPWGEHIPQNIDDTENNNTCWSCHNDSDAPRMATHSSLQTDNDYGDWTVECVVCHNPHNQDQVRKYNKATYLYGGKSTEVTEKTLTMTGAGWQEDEWVGLHLLPNRLSRDYSYIIVSNTADTLTVQGSIQLLHAQAGDTFVIVYGKLIRKAITLDDITDPLTPKTGDRVVRFFYANGPNSFADGDATYDGLCEVCHTETSHWRNDGTLAGIGVHTGYEGSDCTICHPHSQGFRASCNVCHGMPPVFDAPQAEDGLVVNPSPTGSTSAGMHALHATESGYNYSCSTCHFNGMPATSITDDQRVQIGFDIFGFSGDGSVYHGQTLSNSYAYEGTNGTLVDTTMSGTATSCENMYCHSNGTAVATRFFSPSIFPGPSQTSPAWNGSTACDSCHGYGPDYEHLSPKMNAHARHLSLFYQGGINENANPCHVCHKQTTPDGITVNPDFHVNGQYDVAADTGYIFKQNLQPQNQYSVDFDYHYDAGRSTCSNISCHTNVISKDLAWGYGSVSASPHTMRSGDECGEVEFGISVSGAYPLHSVALPVTYSIDWGDGTIMEETVNSSSSPVYSHIYNDASVQYDVTWSVRDANRLSMDTTDMTKTHTLTPFTGNTYPTAAFMVSVDGYTVTLTDQSFDPDYNSCGHEGPGRVIIDWGPGGYESYDLELTDTPSGHQFTHTYAAQPDTHRISYGVYDNVITYPVFLYENVTVP